MTTSDSPLGDAGRPVAQSESRPWLGQRYFPEHPGMRTSPTKLLIVNLIPQHNRQTNNQIHGDSYLGNGPALAKGQTLVHKMRRGAVRLPSLQTGPNLGCW